MRKTLALVGFAVILSLVSSAWALDETLRSTILSALRGNQAAAAQLDPAVHRLLNQLTPEQRRDLLDTEDFTLPVLPDGSTLQQALELLTFNLATSTVDGGGGRSAADPFTLQGTAGQHDAGDVGAGSFLLRGGYWPEGSDVIFSDGFESGDTSAWTATVP